MHELLRMNLWAYIDFMILSGLFVLLLIRKIFQKTKKTESKRKKLFLRFGIGSILVCFWMWVFIGNFLYPIALAYYEYTNEVTEEKSGTLNGIKQIRNDRISFIIDDTEYSMVYISSETVAVGDDYYIEKGEVVKVGDTVTITHGKKSRFVFDIGAT